jgi:hypothetical protein
MQYTIHRREKDKLLELHIKSMKAETFSRLHATIATLQRQLGGPPVGPIMYRRLSVLAPQP